MAGVEHQLTLAALEQRGDEATEARFVEIGLEVEWRHLQQPLGVIAEVVAGASIDVGEPEGVRVEDVHLVQARLDHGDEPRPLRVGAFAFGDVPDNGLEIGAAPRFDGSEADLGVEGGAVAPHVTGFVEQSRGGPPRVELRFWIGSKLRRAQIVDAAPQQGLPRIAIKGAGPLVHLDEDSVGVAEDHGVIGKASQVLVVP